MKSYDNMDLDSMKYADLRSLAKELGLKANMKAEKLLKAIKQHYQREVKKEEAEGQEQDNNNMHKNEMDVQESENAASSPAVFVNTRRGRGTCSKRRISDVAVGIDFDAQVAPDAAEASTENKTSGSLFNARGGKKRKVSNVKRSEKHEVEPQTISSEQQPSIKEEAPICSETEKAPKVTYAGKIPRYQGLQLKTKNLPKQVTPNFKKLHEAQFNKMESIDTYVQRKTKQIGTYKSSVKEQKRANSGVAPLFSPIPLDKKPTVEKSRHTLLSTSKAPPQKPAGKEVAPFRPSVLSTRRINVRFSEATHHIELKKSLVKTPARKLLAVTSSTPKQTAEGWKPSSVKAATFSAQKTPGPFVFTGNTSAVTTPGTQKKQSFDLKASLSRPLTYKPHKGKLKPFGEAQENAVGNKSVLSNTHQESYKNHKVQSRDDRRAKKVEDRKQKKQSILGARRGLVMM
ncbi:unnamed protein product [Menidia menidia]|uniref:(Atlantic silverside) hypothetical protein n=1 Tax=Menidia menidia TaxID=238744 RepID=A0A8S4ARA6_9TELE|nr:unnamed protein product [Menidia menidia]